MVNKIKIGDWKDIIRLLNEEKYSDKGQYAAIRRLATDPKKNKLSVADVAALDSSAKADLEFLLEIVQERRLEAPPPQLTPTPKTVVKGSKRKGSGDVQTKGGGGAATKKPTTSTKKPPAPKTISYQSPPKPVKMEEEKKTVDPQRRAQISQQRAQKKKEQSATTKSEKAGTKFPVSLQERRANEMEKRKQKASKRAQNLISQSSKQQLTKTEQVARAFVGGAISGGVATASAAAAEAIALEEGATTTIPVQTHGDKLKAAGGVGKGGGPPEDSRTIAPLVSSGAYDSQSKQPNVADLRRAEQKLDPNDNIAQAIKTVRQHASSDPVAAPPPTDDQPAVVVPAPDVAYASMPQAALDPEPEPDAPIQADTPMEQEGSFQHYARRFGDLYNRYVTPHSDDVRAGVGNLAGGRAAADATSMGNVLKIVGGTGAVGAVGAVAGALAGGGGKDDDKKSKPKPKTKGRKALGDGEYTSIGDDQPQRRSPIQPVSTSGASELPENRQRRDTRTRIWYPEGVEPGAEYYGDEKLRQNETDNLPTTDPPPKAPDYKEDAEHTPDPADPARVSDTLNEYDDSRSTLRPRYGILGPDQAIPGRRDQLMSDILFDTFSWVQPGFGNGRDNKLFNYQKFWEDELTAVGEGSYPLPDQGQVNWQHPMTWKWQPQMAWSKMDQFMKQEEMMQQKASKLATTYGEGSDGTLGRDVCEAPVSISASGLRRDSRSMFEPIIQLKDNFHPVMEAPGYRLRQQRGERRLFSPWREPQLREIQRHNGGPHLNKYRSMQVILQ